MAKFGTPTAALDAHRNYPFVIHPAQHGWGDLQAARHDWLLAAIAAHHPLTVLDLGSNIGYLGLALAGIDPLISYHGVEISEHLAYHPLAHPNIICGSIEDVIAGAKRTWDIVVMAEILEHLFDPQVVVARAASLATKAILGTVPHENSQWGRGTVESHRHHARYFTREALGDLLANAGGRVRIESDAHFYYFEVLLS